MIQIILIAIATLLIVVSTTLGFVNTIKGNALEKKLIAISTGINELKEKSAASEELAKNLGGEQKKQVDPHWAYDGDLGPAHWGVDYPVCGTGQSQSPIDIRGPFEKTLHMISTAYTTGPLQIINNGHTLQVKVAPGSKMMVNAEPYELVQFDFHRPSEEKIDGTPQAMVIHFVHKNEEGKLVVLGVLLKEGMENQVIKSIWANAPQIAGPMVADTKTTINPNDLLPTEKSFFEFSGSLTTPPCTEGVTFFILKKPMHISKEQVAAFPFSMNARPSQPLNGRKVLTN